MDTFTEAFNILGFALGSKTKTVKNYRQEFDPLFPKPSLGWRKRPPRLDRLEVMEEFSRLPMEEFALLLRELSIPKEDAGWTNLTDDAEKETGPLETYSKRILTGLAAERYFFTTFPRLEEFAGFHLKDVSMRGCGFNFKAVSNNNPDCLAFEAKGLATSSGGWRLTDKEFRVAGLLQDRHHLAIVSNFQEQPILSLHRNPVSTLPLERQEQTMMGLYQRG